MISHTEDDPSDDTADDLRLKDESTSHDDTADDLRLKDESSSHDDCFVPQKKRKYEVFELPTEFPMRPDNVTVEEWFDSSPVTMGPYTINDFQRMWTNSERCLSCTDIESTLAIKGANRAIGKCDSGSQQTAQYGRLEAIGLERIMDLSGLRPPLGSKPDLIIVDIGHGIGNIPIQAAFTGLCSESRGIELVASRTDIAEEMKQCLYEHRLRDFNNAWPEQPKNSVGTIHLRHGRLEDPAHRKFLSGADLAIVNNAHGVMAERARMAKHGDFLIDDYVAAIFAAMKPGGVMFTFYSIDARLGLSRAEATAVRKTHNLTTDELELSFYDSEEFILNENGESMVSWGSASNVQTIYKYTRLDQKTTDGKAMFLCCNPFCEKAVTNELLHATRILPPTKEKRKLSDGQTVTVSEEGKMVINRCSCGGIMQRTRRSRS